MFWADRIREELKTSQHIDDMFTPSGFAHVGSLRGPILHDVVYKSFKEKYQKSVYTYVFNDFDPIDGLPPVYKEKFSAYLGYPTRLAPSPDGKAGSYGEYFSEDFKRVLKSLGMDAEFLSSWDMYHEGKFNEVIKTALENVDKIQDIYSRVSGSKKKERGWFPFQVICPECKKLGTTLVTGWDRERVRFTCEENMVSWARGCGYEGTISPFDGNGKLPWKVDWAAHWKVLGVTFEGAGKDHASRGGSYDIAFAILEEVYKCPKPYYFPYEFFLLGGKKMASSKGIGLNARDLTGILPPELARFLIVRVIPNRALEFDPGTEAIPNLFDEFDRCAQAYWSGNDADMARIFEISQVNDWYKNTLFLPRFRDIVNFLQLPNADILQEIEKQKKSALSEHEREILEERIKYAKIWLEKYAPLEMKTELTNRISSQAASLQADQKQFLMKLAGIINNEKDAESLHNAIYSLIKSSGINPKSAYQAVYLSLTGKPQGPKAAWLIFSLGKEKVVERLKEVAKTE